MRGEFSSHEAVVIEGKEGGSGLGARWAKDGEEQSVCPRLCTSDSCKSSRSLLRSRSIVFSAVLALPFWVRPTAAVVRGARPMTSFRDFTWFDSFCTLIALRWKPPG